MLETINRFKILVLFMLAYRNKIDTQTKLAAIHLIVNKYLKDINRKTSIYYGVELVE